MRHQPLSCKVCRKVSLYHRSPASSHRTTGKARMAVRTANGNIKAAVDKAVPAGVVRAAAGVDIRANVKTTTTSVVAAARVNLLRRCNLPSFRIL